MRVVLAIAANLRSRRSPVRNTSMPQSCPAYSGIRVGEAANWDRCGQFVFTETSEARPEKVPVLGFQRRTRAAPGMAKRDLAATASVCDGNGDGKLTSADAKFTQFKLLVTNADGSTTVKTLAQLGITEINLRADRTQTKVPRFEIATSRLAARDAAPRMTRMAA